MPARAADDATAPQKKYSLGVLIRFEGEIGPMLQQYFYRKLDEARQLGADLVIVEIDSPGGLAVPSVEIAQKLSEVDWAHTVAYVPRQALSGAAVVALGCDDIVMAPEAQLGDVGAIVQDENFMFRYAPEKFLSFLVAAMRGLAEAKGRPPALAEAMVEMDMVVYKAKNRRTGEITYMSNKEIASSADPGDWQKQVHNEKRGETAYMTEAEIQASPNPGDWEPVTVYESREKHFLEVSGSRAVELGLARATVSSREELNERYATAEPLVVLRPTAIDTAVSILNNPLVTGLLFIIGLIALYVEFSSPGIGLGGLIAGLCFALFFWSRFLGGTAGWLDVLLFLAGIIFLVVELFILPGFGVAGVTGILLIGISLVMAGMHSFPSTSRQWATLTTNLLVLGVSVVVVGVAAYFLSRHFGTLPLVSRLMLAPPGRDHADAERKAPPETHKVASPELERPLSLGERGVSTTPLRPAGKARFGQRLADVVTDGDFLERNTPIEVTEVVGNRVVVREAEARQEA